MQRHPLHVAPGHDCCVVDKTPQHLWGKACTLVFAYLFFSFFLFTLSNSSFTIALLLINLFIQTTIHPPFKKVHSVILFLRSFFSFLCEQSTLSAIPDDQFTCPLPCTYRLPAVGVSLPALPRSAVPAWWRPWVRQWVSPSVAPSASPRPLRRHLNTQQTPGSPEEEGQLASCWWLYSEILPCSILHEFLSVFLCFWW